MPSAVAVRHLTYEAGHPSASKRILDDVSFSLPPGHFTAIIGASGCGKSTLLRTLTGLLAPTTGDIFLLGHSLADYKAQYPLALGYLPQFSEAHEDLTIEEILRFCADLQLPGSVNPGTREKWLAYLIQLAGLDGVRHQRYKSLSGGQRRRLALAETLMPDPPILLVDELTSGLDPRAEASMMEWLGFLSHQSGKTILLVTHAVKNLDQTDSVLFMKKGRLFFHGNHRDLLAKYQASSIEELYQEDDPAPRENAGGAEKIAAGADGQEEEPAAVRTAGPASAWQQFIVLLKRHFLLFSRDRAQMILHAVLLLTFPALVAVFALGGLPQVRSLSLSLDTNIIRSLQEQLLYLKDSMSSATLVSGLIMFQVILLTLAGSNNGAREIAKERGILEKEQRCGLSSWAYVSSKMVHVILLAFLQSFWMTWFVKSTCNFPGAFSVQFSILFLTTLAMGTTCLAISSCSSSTEKASLQAIYLVGLQLPLSGAVLALPEWLVWITRPFIAAYWGWSGYLKCLSEFRIYDIVRQTTKTWLAAPALVCGVLACHIILAYAWSVFFVNRRKCPPSH
ncbi:MAG: ATP-binding cassette domain-containing protein [Verrucomicrobiae bacterium]|nr:ATP-binding cassette domain-containing protein [Verrucomicrobiae bacterium]